MSHHLFFGAGRRSHIYQCKGVVFDGAADYMNRGAGLTGAADGKVFLVSFWVKFNADGAETYIFNSTGASFWVRRKADNKVYIEGYDAASGAVVVINTSAILSAAGWTHIMASRLGTTIYLYVDNASDKTETTNVDVDIDFTKADWAIGADVGGGNKINAELAEFYFTTEGLDLSAAANRARIISSVGKPANLGATGSVVTGTAPLVYQSVRIGDAETAFATNRGTGGNFVITGTLALSATSPSD